MISLVEIARNLNRIARRLDGETAEGTVAALLREREQITRILCNDWQAFDYSPVWQYPNETRYF